MKYSIKFLDASSLSYDAEHQAVTQVSTDDGSPVVIQFRKNGGRDVAVVIEVEDGAAGSDPKSHEVAVSLQGAKAEAAAQQGAVAVPDVQGEPVDDELVRELMPIFKNKHDEVVDFVRSIDGAPSTMVTGTVNELLREGKICKTGCKKYLWSILHRYGYYTKLNRTWNLQVNF